ncbi:hypothetical protein [Streptomyces albidoflavus]|nr:hypothetical protein [Streptomyces albidoflavus]
MFFEIAALLGAVLYPMVRLVIGVVALHRCDSRDVPEVVKALAFGKQK